MSEDTGLALNWRALVAEAIRRRKAERLTQKEHAALAGVSAPTIIGFDRGDATLTLAKAFDILRVVGLLDEFAGPGALETLVNKPWLEPPVTRLRAPRKRKSGGEH